MSHSAGFTFMRQHRQDLRRSAVGSTSTTVTLTIPASLPNEIFANICHQILPPDSSELPRREVITGRRTLRNLALACTGRRREVALDALWACLDHLRPLVDLLPEVSSDDHPQYFSGTGLAGDGALRRYANRVRVLHVVSPLVRGRENDGVTVENMRPGISAEVSFFLARELAGQPLLPNLRKVIIEDGVLGLCDLSMLYSPSVETVALAKGGSRISATLFYGQFVPVALLQFPRAKSLSIQCDNQAGGRSYPILHKISQMRALQSLDLRLPGSGIDVRPLLHMLRSLDCLTSITLDIHFEFHRTSCGEFRQSAANLGLVMEKLTTVHLVNRATGSLCLCIPECLLERATRLTMVTNEAVDINTPSGLISPNVVRRLASIPTLKRLDVEGGTVTGTDAFLPLVQYVGLEELNISVYQNQQPNPFPLVKAARDRRWPVLKSLSVGCRGRQYGWELRPIEPPAVGVQVTCLQHIAEDAKPGLEHLALELLPLSSPAAWQGMTDQCTPSAFVSGWLHDLRRCKFVSKSVLQTLAIRVPGWAAATAPSLQMVQDLARILDIIFPSLEEIRPFTDKECREAYWTGEWAHVEELRRFYRKHRLSSS